MLGSGIHPAIRRANSAAVVMLAMPGNRRCNAAAAGTSPPVSNAARIVAAWSSVTVNIRRAWALTAGMGKRLDTRPPDFVFASLAA